MLSPRLAYLSVAALCAASALRVAPSDPSFYFSPYGWLVSPSNASTINTGSYFRVLFTGDTATLTFDVSQMVSPPSQVYWRIDNSPMISAIVNSTIVLTVPVNLTHGDVPYHALEVVVKSTTERANRWAADQPSTRVIFTGLLLDAGAVVAAFFPSDVNLLIYGCVRPSEEVALARCSVG